MTGISILVSIILFAVNGLFSQKLKNVDGFFVETPIRNNPFSNKYTDDNISYRENSKFHYGYVYIDATGKKWNFNMYKFYQNSKDMYLEFL
jgi:hypothetical protein